MTSVVEMRLSSGDILYREGDTNESAYVIESGEVILYTTRLGRRTDIERRGAGAILGELSILTGQPRAVTVEALTPCTVYRISAQQIVNRFEKLDPVLRACVETSISFTTAFVKQTSQAGTAVPIAPSTLRDPDHLIQQFRLETDLVRGLDKDEFSLLYQPIVQLSDRSIVGFEALMRWQHPQLGPVSPDLFIEVAEKTGSIKLITEFVIVEACATLKRIRDLGQCPKNLYASVNVSAQDIGGQGFVEFLAFVFDMNDLQPHHIRLEVTETALIPDFDIADKNLKQLRRLGCGISIDDFGTGYSNLAYLKSLPITSLKIDRAFVRDADEDPVSRSIVKMLVTLGQDLGVDIIAEGLESDGAVNMICDLGCRFAQGYYFCRPVCESDLISLLSGTLDKPDVA